MSTIIKPNFRKKCQSESHGGKGGLTQVLSRLSDSNRGPSVYKTDALTPELRRLKFTGSRTLIRFTEKSAVSKQLPRLQRFASRSHRYAKRFGREQCGQVYHCLPAVTNTSAAWT